MSAPQTNIEKQKKRHWGPLVGMAIAVAFGVLVIVYWIGEEISGGDPARPASGEINQPTQAPTEMITPDAQQREGESPAAPPTTAPPAGSQN